MGNDKVIKWIKLIPVILFTSVVMLIVHVHAYTMPFSQFDYMNIENDTVLYDIFSYYKMVAIIAITVVSLIILIYLIITKKITIRKTKLNIIVLLYAVMVIVSYIASNNKEMSLFGTMDRFEGTITQLCYMFMFFYTINIVREEYQLKTVVNSLLITSFIAGLIGLSQLSGHDFLFTEIGNKLIAGGYDIMPNFSKGEVYQTVYNTNYVALYLTLIIPIVVFRLFESKKSTKTVVMYSALLIVYILNMIGAHSAGGVIGLSGAALIAICAAVIRYKGELFISKKSVKAVIVLAIICMVGCTAVFMTNRHKYLIDYDYEPDTRPYISYIVTGDSYIEFEIDNEYLKINVDENKDLSITDEKGELLNVASSFEDESIYVIEDNRYAYNIRIRPIILDKELYIIAKTYQQDWVFHCAESGIKYINSYGKETKLGKVEHFGNIRNYDMASGRGYIWSLTIPVLKKYVIAGSGADTFMTAINQYDDAVKYSVYGELQSVVDKPHNMYMQIWVNTGMMSLVLFMTLVILVISNAKAYINNRDKSNISADISMYLKGMLIGLTGFLIAAIVNDSSVSVMPMFYGILGCMYVDGK